MKSNEKHALTTQQALSRYFEFGTTDFEHTMPSWYYVVSSSS